MVNGMTLGMVDRMSMEGSIECFIEMMDGMIHCVVDGITIRTVDPVINETPNDIAVSKGRWKFQWSVQPEKKTISGFVDTARDYATARSSSIL